MRAVLWSTIGQPKDLNTLVSLPPGLVLMQAAGINAKGQIVVLGKDLKDIHGNHEGTSRVFLLTPRNRKSCAKDRPSITEGQTRGWPAAPIFIY